MVRERAGLAEGKVRPAGSEASSSSRRLRVSVEQEGGEGAAILFAEVHRGHRRRRRCEEERETRE
jgi:hypothetical protein